MPLPGREDDDGVEAMSLDERIVKLRANAQANAANPVRDTIISFDRVVSFRLRNHAISPLCGQL